MNHTLNEHEKSSTSKSEKPDGPTGGAKDLFADLTKLVVPQGFNQLGVKKKVEPGAGQAAR